MNPDFAEILAELSAAGAQFLVVGAHAVAAHARPRATGDLDVWVRPTSENAEKVWSALVAFGAPLHELTEEDLTSEDLVFQMGVEPGRIDILTTIEGVRFEDAWNRRMTLDLGGQSIPLIGLDDLIQNKRALGRPKDLADLDELERSR
jgi:predicted nucleotidyltransferase